MADIVDPIEQASYDLVHDFPGGAVKLAAFLTVGAGTLNHKVNPAVDTHHLTLQEAITSMYVAKDFRLLHAICDQLGFMCVPVGHIEGVSDLEFLTLFSKAMKEVGDIANAINETFEAKQVEQHEVNRVRKEVFEAIPALAELPRRLQGMCEDL